MLQFCSYRHTATLLLAILSMFAPSERVSAQGTDQLFPDPMGFEQMSELLAPLDLSDQQRQFVRGEHRVYLEAFRQLRENEINAYLSDIGSMSLEYSDDRDKIVDGTKRVRAILDRIHQLDNDFFARIKPTLSEAQAARLGRLADRRARQRFASRHGSWDWSIPGLANLDLARLIQSRDLEEDQRAAIDAALAAYEQTLTPIYRRVHANRLDLPLAHHDKTAEARQLFEQRMAEIEARMSAPGADRDQAQRDLQSLVREGDYWQPATSNYDVDEAKSIREDITRISRMNRQLLSEFAAVLDADTMRPLERSYERRAFGMLRIPSDPLRRLIARKLNADDSDDELRAAIQSLYDTYTMERRPLVHQLLSHAEDQEFVGTGRLFRSGTESADESPVEKDRAQIRQLNERTLQAYAALTGDEVPTGGEHRITLGDGPIIIDNSDGSGATIEIAGDLRSDDSADGGEAELSGVFITAAGGDGEVTVEGSHMIVIEASPGDSSFEIETGLVNAGGVGGVRVPRGWLPGAMLRSEIRDAAVAAGIPEAQLPIVDAMHEEYHASFDQLDESILSQVKERLSSLRRPGDGDDVTDSDIDSAFASVRSAMEAINNVDRALFSNLAVVAGVKEEDPNLQRSIRERLRFSYRHRGQGTVSRALFGAGVESREHEVDVARIVDEVQPVTEQPLPVRESLDAYSSAAVELVRVHWQEELQQAAMQAKRMRQIQQTITSGEGSFALSVFEPARRAEEGAGDAQPGPDYQQLLRDLNRSTLKDTLGALDPDSALEVESTYKERAFPAAYRDREALHTVFDKIEEAQPDPAILSRVRELKLEYTSEYNAIAERMIAIIRDFTDNAGSRGMMPMGTIDSSYFEQMRQNQQKMEVERFARRSLNESTRQALYDMLGQEMRDVVGLRQDN